MAGGDADSDFRAGRHPGERPRHGGAGRGEGPRRCQDPARAGSTRRILGYAVTPPARHGDKEATTMEVLYRGPGPNGTRAEETCTFGTTTRE